MSLSIDRSATGVRLAQAAVRLFATKGFAATGIRDLARELEMTTAALYHHVAGKEQLLVNIMTSCLDEYLRLAHRAVDSSTDPLVQLCRLVHSHVAGECTNPLTSLVTDREVRSLTGEDLTVVMDRRDRFETLYRDVLTAGDDQGHFRLIDPTVTRLGLIEMCNSVAHWYRPGGGRSMADLQDTHALLARRLVGATSRRAIAVDPKICADRLASEPEATRS